MNTTTVPSVSATAANSSIATPANASQPSWWERFQEQGCAFRWVASATIVTGIYLHVTRLLIGDALLQQYILTPLFDQSFALPIAYAGMSGLLSWRRMHFRGRGHKALVGFIVFYMLASVPLHVATWFTQSTANFSAFPRWFSLLLQPYYTVVLLALWHLQFKSNTEPRREL